ncbi:MAG: 2,3-bisphosphoglycerate-independent phosphoglycerate mutase [Gemmatimonadota bacterium]|nr:2,3-bisphosphoglycerate-independent phosphoglycerate mutase [Gemmatimonadota bacterium]
MTIRHKGILIILDGLGDRPVEAFSGRTPLEAAETVHLDRIAASGQCGLMDPLGPGIPVDTATGTGMLLGASPGSVMGLARGPVEAAGVGLEIAPGDLALRCNFATLERRDGRLAVIDRRAGRIRSGTAELASALADVDLGNGITATLAPATQHRAVLRLSGPGLSAEIGDTDPGVVPLPSPVLRSKARQREDVRASRSAAAVNRFVDEAHARLSAHPLNRERIESGRPAANGIITRGAGLAGTGRSVIERLGLTGIVVAGESTVLGLASLFGMRSFTDPRFTGLPDTDVEAKVATALEALETADVVFLHLKGADICSHDFDPEGKRNFLERVDGALAPFIGRDVVIGVTGDHSSDCGTGGHSGDPVPALLTAPRGRRDEIDRFGETACVSGGLGRLTANSYVMVFLDQMGAVPEWRAGTVTFPSGPDGWVG